MRSSPSARAAPETMQRRSGDADSAFGFHWDLPYDDLDRVWPHVGLREDARREVKEVKLRELMRTPAWSAAPTALRPLSPIASSRAGKPLPL
ncbi:hypothetical protein OG523_00905 [Streptomyces virginiae]|uniref:hypothetical protein n=1 Tax=Streptomyces virginiae TaxID=1961 RepID=UPI002E367958|nr:hypothetical protein [Streptomyces virginiae]